MPQHAPASSWTGSMHIGRSDCCGQKGKERACCAQLAEAEQLRRAEEAAAARKAGAARRKREARAARDAARAAAREEAARRAAEEAASLPHEAWALGGSAWVELPLSIAYLALVSLLVLTRMKGAFYRMEARAPPSARVPNSVLLHAAALPPSMSGGCRRLYASLSTTHSGGWWSAGECVTAGAPAGTGCMQGAAEHAVTVAACVGLVQDWRRGTRRQRRLLALLVVPCTAALLAAAGWAAWKLALLTFGAVWAVFCWLLWDPPVTSVIIQTVLIGALPCSLLSFYQSLCMRGAGEREQTLTHAADALARLMRGAHASWRQERVPKDCFNLIHSTQDGGAGWCCPPQG